MSSDNFFFVKITTTQGRVCCSSSSGQNDVSNASFRGCSRGNVTATAVRTSSTQTFMEDNTPKWQAVPAVYTISIVEKTQHYTR